MVCYMKCVITSGYASAPVQAEPSVALPAYKALLYPCKDYIVIELSDYFDYIKNRDVSFTIVILMLVCYNRDSYSSFKDP